MYLHERENWTAFTWDDEVILPLLSDARFRQGQFLGTMNMADASTGIETELRSLSDEVIASSKIEGVVLNAERVESALSRHLGISVLPEIELREEEGAVDIVVDATQNAWEPLTNERLFRWHEALFPSGQSGLHTIKVGAYRDTGMQVVSGAIGREKIHYTAPDSERVPGLMDEYLDWLNENEDAEPLLKAGVAHIWFLSIHPFDDGNGRIARALTELLLARSDQSQRRFYSLSAYILSHRKQYYEVLERTQKGTSDITLWLTWFLHAVEGAIESSEASFEQARKKELFWRSIANVPLNERQTLMLDKLLGNFQGKLTAKKWAKICKVSHDTALRDINDLMGKGVLIRAESGGRSTAYLLSNSTHEPT